MDQDINTPNSIWGTIKESVIYIIKSETASTASKLNLLFGIIAILFLIGCGATSLADYVVKLIRPNIEIGFPAIYIVLMFLGTLIYFWKCIDFVQKDSLDKKELRQ